MRWLAEQGHAVLGVDRSAEALQTASQWGDTLQADLEDGSPWPLPGRQFGAVVVTNYLWRPLWAQILDSVKPGGVLLYDTIAHPHSHMLDEATATMVDLDVSPETLSAIIRQAIADQPGRVEVLLRIRAPQPEEAAGPRKAGRPRLSPR